MKKICIFISLLLVSFAAKAEWDNPIYKKADALKGREAYYSYFYHNQKGSFCCWSDTCNWGITCSTGIFDYDMESYVDGLIGLYVGDELVQKFEIPFYVTEADKSLAYPTFRRADVILAVLNHLKYKGDVRIVIPRYGQADFDFVITKNSEINFKE